MPRLTRLCAAMAAASLLASGSAALGSSSKDGAQAQTVCKKRAQTGTRFAKKRCMTRTEWAVAEEEAKRRAQEAINAPRVNMERSN